ncbi:hypothetical protein BS627_23595 [Agrobacterium salinitolerans]|nr:hypothetical protein BS627_23595 [Agrobacterium salinitolerans]PNQ19886.1 hypothetical protein C2E26_23970 [Rhizobium sp. YIC5082]
MTCLGVEVQNISMKSNMFWRALSLERWTPPRIRSRFTTLKTLSTTPLVRVEKTVVPEVMIFGFRYPNSLVMSHLWPTTRTPVQDKCRATKFNLQLTKSCTMITVSLRVIFGGGMDQRNISGGVCAAMQSSCIRGRLLKAWKASGEVMATSNSPQLDQGHCA